MGQVNPRLTVAGHLVEHVVAEKLEHVAVTRLCPLHVANHTALKSQQLK